jgi:hypothetical protein
MDKTEMNNYPLGPFPKQSAARRQALRRQRALHRYDRAAHLIITGIAMLLAAVGLLALLNQQGN